jgi:hypothetical protein
MRHRSYATTHHFLSTLFISTSLFSTPFFSTFFLLTMSGCGFFPEKGDTEGDQQQAQWLTSARLVVDTDPTLTIIRLRGAPLDSAHGGHHLILARYDFNPDHTILGDEYSLNIALDLGDIRTVKTGTPYPLGPPGRIAAVATVSCLCSPLRPDSVRGTFGIIQRGMTQIIARIDATLFFTEWNDSTQHATYRLRQRLDALR